MLYFRIGFENGDSLETGFNGTLEEAKAYYLGRVFNLGAVDDDMQRCNSVEQLPTLEMGLAAWIASGGLVVITDGTVSRQVVSVLVDGLDFRLVVDGWKNPVCLPMVDAYHLEGWKVEHSGSSLYIMPDMENTRMMRRKTREQRRKLMRKQKLYGLVFVLLSILICLVCATGKTPEDRDATAVVLLLPFGLYLIFTKEICICG